MTRALLITVVCAGMAHAQQPDGAPSPDAGKAGTVRVSDCKMPACIMVNGADFAGLVVGNNLKADRIADLERQLADLRKSKGCAKLEVTEPPRFFVPHKEHDS